MNAEDRNDVLQDTLRELEILLLDYEQTVSVERDANEALLKIAGTVHALKSKLRRVERPAAAMLLQGLETLVTCYRKRAEPLSREAIDTLLGAFDTITEGLHDSQESRERIDAVSDRVLALIDDQQLTEPSGKRRRFPFDLNPTEQARVTLAKEQGERPFIVEKMIPSQLELADYNNLPVYEPLRSLGRVLAVRPAFAELDRSRTEVVLQIVATTAQTDDQVRRTLSGPYDYCDWPSPTPQAPAAESKPVTAPTPEPTIDLTLRQPRRILIVEDEFISRSLLLALLSSYGACDVAVDGREAVAAVAQAILEQNPYSLVCLDIMMPDMDGHQALEALRKAETEAAIPPERRAKVVMTTALSDYDNFHRAYQASCDSYIVKPISKSVLTRQLRRIGIVPSV